MRTSKEGWCDMKVMVVEHDVNYAHFLATLAEQCGCDVKLYHCGRSALEDAPTLKPDIVLLSLSLPDMEGPEFARQLRQHRPVQSTSIVAVSGELTDTRSVKRFNIDTGLVYPWHQAGVECIMQRLAIAADQQTEATA
jgi:DNA-binding response OmpR family regulator